MTTTRATAPRGGSPISATETSGWRACGRRKPSATAARSTATTRPRLELPSTPRLRCCGGASRPTATGSDTWSGRSDDARRDGDTARDGTSDRARYLEERAAPCPARGPRTGGAHGALGGLAAEGAGGRPSLSARLYPRAREGCLAP